MQFMQRHFRREFIFVRDRISPAGLYGLYFTIGAVVLFGSAWLFGGISEDLIAHDPLIVFDELVSAWMREHTNSKFATAMQFASGMASAIIISILSLLAGGYFIWRRLWYRLLGLVLAVAGGMLLNIALKNLFDRARPGWADPLLALTGPGFPSGHTMMATITYGCIAVFLLPRITSTAGRTALAGMTITLVLVVALSRMVLGAHYLSDVLAAMAAGIAWLALCLTAAETLRRYRGLALLNGRA